MNRMAPLCVVSGGLDSTVLAYSVAASHPGPHVIVSFDYGQRHVKELDFAAVTAAKLSAEHLVVPMGWLAQMIAGTSSLVTDGIAVPDGHYAQESMRATVVPNRNAVMLNVAAAVAIARGAPGVATAVHAGDHFIYPDCRPAFVAALIEALRVGNEGFCSPEFTVLAPFVEITKAEIVTIGAALNVPFADTWSCYKGGDVHCGACGTCFERREAFEVAGVTDPTVYASTPRYAAPT